LKDLITSGKYKDLLNLFLDEDGLGYGKLPKGLIKFHSYKDRSRTSFEEHLVEGAELVRSGENIVRIHFTVSPEHMDSFISHYEDVKNYYEHMFSVRYEVGFSSQKSSTDIIAVDLNNNPLKNDKSEIVFRPGGHGALLENLNAIDHDIIFIKNIDNIAPDRIKKDTYRYKKLLAGILLEYQKNIFRYLEILERSIPEENVLEEKQFRLMNYAVCY
jgi:hypothetical protein